MLIFFKIYILLCTYVSHDLCLLFEFRKNYYPPIKIHFKWSWDFKNFIRQLMGMKQVGSSWKKISNKIRMVHRARLETL